MNETDDALREALKQKAHALINELAQLRKRRAAVDNQIASRTESLQRLAATAQVVDLDLPNELRQDLRREADIPDGVSTENMIVIQMNDAPDKLWAAGELIDALQGWTDTEEPTLRAALSRACRYGYLQRPRHGHYLLTEEGKQVAEQVLARMRKEAGDKAGSQTSQERERARRLR